MEKETKVYNFPVKETDDEIDINALIDALFDIRLSLSIKRITSPTIKKDELRNLVDNTKNDKNEAVRNALDEVFEVYLGKENIKQSNLSNNKYTIEDIDRIIDKKIRYEQEEELKNKKLILNQDKVA